MFALLGALLVDVINVGVIWIIDCTAVARVVIAVVVVIGVVI